MEPEHAPPHPDRGPEGREITALLLPGMTLNASIFPEFDVPTIAVDFNELALGPQSRSIGQGKMDLYARMLDDFLRGVSEWRHRRRIVVAHSFGGMLALWWLLSGQAEAPRGIHGLVLIATTAGPMFRNVRLRVGRMFGRDWRIGLAPFVPVWNLPIVTRTVKRILSGGQLGARRVDFRSLTSRTDLAVDLAGWRNTDWRAMRSYRTAMMGYDVRDRLAALDVRTIVLHGTRDTLFPLAVAQELAQRLPRAELRVVEGAGHGLPLTNGAAVRQAVEDLLA